MIFFILDVALNQVARKLNIAEREVIKLLGDVKVVPEQSNFDDSAMTDFVVCPPSK